MPWLRKPKRRAFVLALLLSVSARAELPAPIHGMEFSTPRDFAIVMGEIVRGDVRVAVASGYQLETSQLPQEGAAINDFLELRRLAWTQEARAGDTVYRIAFDYQVFKGVREAEQLTVPALPLRFRQGDQAVTVEIPAWRFTLTPLIAPKTPDEAVSLRGDRPAPLYPAQGYRLALAGLLAAIAGLGVYAAWRLRLPPFRRDSQPFARVLRSLKKLRRQPPTVESYRQALRQVHGALNETAGHPLYAGRLQDFLVERPEYAGLQIELEQFFAISGRMFFAPGEPSIPADYPFSRLESLCRRLRAAARPGR